MAVTHIHLHAYNIYAYMHVVIHTYKLKHICLDICIQIFMHILILVWLYVCTFIHKYIHFWLHTYISTYIENMCIYALIYMYIQIHACVSIQTHTHIYIYVCVCVCVIQSYSCEMVLLKLINDLLWKIVRLLHLLQLIYCQLLILLTIGHF